MQSRLVRYLVLPRRAVVVTFALVLLAWGIHSFRQLPIEPYPNISPMNVQIITQWPGRSALEVERLLTIPIETAVAGVPNLKALRSISLFGLSVVTLQFHDFVDSFHARQDTSLFLTNGVSLPPGVTPVLGPDSDAVGEVMRYAVIGDGVDLMTLKTWQDWDIHKHLKYVPGVAEVTGFGGLVKQYQVLPDPQKLFAYNITLSQLTNALANANANVGGGLISYGEQLYTVRGVGLIRSLDDIRRIVIGTNQGVPVRVGDIAEVRVGHAPRLGVVQLNDSDDIVEGIVLARRKTNASEMLQLVREKIQEINKSLLPKNIRIVPFYDRQELLDMTTTTVRHTLFIGMSLVFVFLHLFLGNLRAACIVAAVIPLSLCVSFIGMYYFKVPANLISLGAIDFGIIVDAAVIVMENITRHVEAERSYDYDTISTAVGEVQRAMVFSTLISMVAYSPLLLWGGVEGKIFLPMADTMAFALLGSIVLSLTLVPAAASFVFREGFRPHTPPFVPFFIRRYYRPCLAWLLARPKAVMLTAWILFLFAVATAFTLGTSFLPTLDENNLWIRITLPSNVDLAYSKEVAHKIRMFLYKQPEVRAVSVQIGRPDDGTDPTGVFNQEYGVYFKHPKEWPKGVRKKDIIRRFEDYFATIPGISYNFSQYIQDNVAEALSGVKGENSIKIFGTELERLDSLASQIKAILQGVRGITDLGVLRELGQPILNVTVDRIKSARFGLNVSDIENVVLYALAGTPVTQIIEGERTFDLVIRFPEGFRNTVEQIQNLLVDTPDGHRIPLSMVAEVRLENGPFFIYRESGRRYIAIKFGVRGRDLGTTIAEAQTRVGREVSLPQGYSIQWHGEFQQMREAHRKLAIIIPLTLLAIFFLLYSTFGSAKDAAIVLANVPFSVIGGIAALKLAGEVFSISAGIGFLSLFGIATQDAVILTSYIRKLMAQGDQDILTAILDGSCMRFRPVLMTALLASFGLLPAALSHAVGSQAQRPLALVIVGGMISTTVLTLLVQPVLISWVYRARGSHTS